MRWGLRKNHKFLQALPAVFAACALSACGDAMSLDLEETLSIGMIGVFEAPAGAAGNSEPRSMTFTLTGITVVDADGNTKELFEQDPTSYTIISRPQIIFETGMKDFVGQTLTSVSATFEAAVSAAGKTSNAHVLTMTQPTVRFTDGLAISKAKTQRLDIHVRWKDIITYDADSKSEALTLPSLIFVPK